MNVFPLIGTIIPLFLVSCISLSPRENFFEIMNATVGRDLNKIEPYDFGYPKRAIKTNQLPNGNFENEYMLKNTIGTCIYVFEIDPKTNKILSWRIEGDPNACIVNP